MNLRRLSVAAAVLAMYACPAAAAGRASRGATDEAQAHFDRGKELYDDNDLQGALVEFQRAYDLVPSYKLLYNIAQIDYQLQDYPAAIRTFTRYLQEGQGEITPQRREEVQRELSRLRSRVATLKITTNRPQAEVSVDDVTIGKTPLAEPVLVSAGRRRVSAVLPGYAPATKLVEVAGQDLAEVSLELVPLGGPGGRATALPPATLTAPPPAGLGRAPARHEFPLVPWIAAGGLAVAAGASGGLALYSSSRLQTLRNTFGSTREQLDAAARTTQTWAITTDALLGGALVAAGVSTFLMLGSGTPAEPGATVQLGAGPAGLAMTGTF